MRPLRRLLVHTWLWLRRDLHDFDLSQEPESQRRFRHRIVREVRAMEYDPYTQWRYHLVMSWVWIISAVPILILFFGFPVHWLRWGLLITLLYSLYANWVSDFTGLHAAWAALRGNQIAEKQDIARAEDHIVAEVQELSEEISGDADL